MHTNPPAVLPNFWQCSCKPILSAAWIIGLILGIWLAACAGDSSSLTMRGVEISTVSIPGLLLVTSLPFLITASAVFLSQPWLLILLALGKAASFGFCLWELHRFYGSGFWLAAILTMSSDLAALPLLTGFLLRCGDRKPQLILKDLALCLIAVICFCVGDAMFITPFAASLL